MTHDSQPTTDECRRVWNNVAAYWDQEMAAGRTWQRVLIHPAAERLLEPKRGEIALEIGCGNGEFARRLAELGLRVLATDFSAEMVARARMHGGNIEYRVADGTKLDELLALGEAARFDLCVCNMTIMDMSDVEPLAKAVRQLVRPHGRFVFSIQHPAFNSGSTARVIEEVDSDDGVQLHHSIKISRYARARVGRGVALGG